MHDDPSAWTSMLPQVAQTQAVLHAGQGGPP